MGDMILSGYKYTRMLYIIIKYFINKSLNRVYFVDLWFPTQKIYYQMKNNILNDHFLLFRFFPSFVWTCIVAVMKILSILMVGCLLHTIQATNNPKQDFQLEDGLSTFKKL